MARSQAPRTTKKAKASQALAARLVTPKVPKSATEAAKLQQEYKKYFLAPASTPGQFEILTAFDYQIPTHITNHS